MSDFEVIWKMYPRKVAKRVAEKSWSKLSTGEKNAAIEAMPNHLEYWKRSDTQKEFIPHLSTWLNQGRWEDELEMPESKNNIKVSWWTSETETIKKAQELGVQSRGGEGWSEFRQRIAERMKAA